MKFISPSKKERKKNGKKEREKKEAVRKISLIQNRIDLPDPNSGKL